MRSYYYNYYDYYFIYKQTFSKSAGAVKYTNCIFKEG